MLHLSRQRSAFALRDLVAVILMLTIAAFLCLPGIFRAETRQALVACTNNLREIGGAYHAFLDANKGNARSLQSNHPGWRGQIDEFLKADSTAFKCLNEEPPARKELPDAIISVYEKFDRPELLRIPLSLDSAMMRVSLTKTCVTGFVLEMGLPSGWRERSWNDLDIRVEPQPDGSFKLTAVHSTPSPYHFDLLDSYGQPLVYDFEPFSPTNSYTFPPEIAYSYGMNPAAKKFQLEDDGNKVLIAEYTKPVCSVIDMRNPYSYRQLSSTDYWPHDFAPRHNGKLNVLFMNGAVKTLSPGDINPRRPALAKEYWLPTPFVPPPD